MRWPPTHERHPLNSTQALALPGWRRTGTFCSALLVVMACVPPAPRAPQVPVSPALTADRFRDPRLVCDPDGSLYLVASEKTAAGQRLFVAASSDHGENWRILPSLGDGISGVRRRPLLATAARDEIFVVWEDTRAGGVGIWFNGSRDGGRTWLPADRRVDSGGANSHPRSPVVACDDRGTVYVAWLDDRDGFDTLYFNVSRDHGVAWESGERRIGNLSLGRRARPRLACDVDGTVYTTWVEEQGGASRVYFNGSRDRGSTWQFEALPLSQGTGALGAEICAADYNMATVVWLEEEAGAARIEASVSEDQGRTWSPVPLAGGTSSALLATSLPRVACGGGQQIYVAWHGLANDGTSRIVLDAARAPGSPTLETVLARSQPIGPAAFAPDQRWIEPPFAMAADRAGNVYLAWIQGAVGAPSVGFDRVTSYGRVWSQVPAGPESFGHDPVDAGAPQLAADEFGHVCVLWNEGSRLHVASSPFYGEAGWRHTDL